MNKESLLENDELYIQMEEGKQEQSEEEFIQNVKTMMIEKYDQFNRKTLYYGILNVDDSYWIDGTHPIAGVLNASAEEDKQFRPKCHIQIGRHTLYCFEKYNVDLAVDKIMELAGDEK